MLKDFKEFAIRGNVIDLAVGIIIGVAFNSVVNSLVNDILMPPIGLILANVDFQNMFVTLWGSHFKTVAEARSGGAVTLNYGTFVNSVINFLIVAFCVFFLVRQINKLKKKAPQEARSAFKECPYCKMTINNNAVKCPHCTSDLK